MLTILCRNEHCHNEEHLKKTKKKIVEGKSGPFDEIYGSIVEDNGTQ
jgi:hypothetical protein